MPPHLDVDDVEQDVHLKLLHLLGPEYAELIEKALSRGVDFYGSTEHRAIQAAFKQALGNAQSAFLQRRRRGRLQELPLEREPESHADTAKAQALLDLTLDVADSLTRLSDREKQVWCLSQEGYTTRDIAGVMGVDFRRVAELRLRIITKLAAVLRG